MTLDLAHYAAVVRQNPITKRELCNGADGALCYARRIAILAGGMSPRLGELVESRAFPDVVTPTAPAYRLPHADD